MMAMRSGCSSAENFASLAHGVTMDVIPAAARMKTLLL